MEKLRALHIASYNGNIGDIANHNGFRNSVSQYTDFEIEYTNLEMRNFYKSWGINKFDDEFVRLANEFDLVIFGGGGFWALDRKESSTGTTIDLSDSLLEKIDTPILFNGLGTDINENTNDEIRGRFCHFLNTISSSDKYFVTVRNDGSKELLDDIYEGQFRDLIHKIPDGGFFARIPEYEQGCVAANKINVTINVAMDDVKRRFPGGEKNSWDSFTDEIAYLCREMCKNLDKCHIIFVPHIPSDIVAIGDIVRKLSDRTMRECISVAPYTNGVVTDGLSTFDIYRKSSLSIRMRYHANVVPIGLNVPTLAICNVEPNLKLIEDIGFNNRCIRSDERGFSEKLLPKCFDILKSQDEVLNENAKTMSLLNNENEKYMRKLEKWILNNIH